MITATFSKEQKGRILTLKLSGHAGMAEAGRDIVCASATILAYTVAQEAKNMEKRDQLNEPPIIKMEEGDIEITVHPRIGDYHEAIHTFYIAQVGYTLLAYNYPQYVELIQFNETGIQS